jgi:hypothetical protein
VLDSTGNLAVTATKEFGFSEQSLSTGAIETEIESDFHIELETAYGLTCSQISGVTARRSVGVNRRVLRGRSSTCCIIKVLI